VTGRIPGSAPSGSRQVSWTRSFVPMSTHVVIRRREFVAGRRIEIVTQTSKPPRVPTPMGSISVGERVWMKWTPGRELVATALVESFVELPMCTLREVQAATAGYGLHGHAPYWDDLRKRKGEPLNALVVYLTEGRWLARPYELVEWPSHNQDSWIVDPPEAAMYPVA